MKFDWKFEIGGTFDFFYASAYFFAYADYVSVVTFGTIGGADADANYFVECFGMWLDDAVGALCFLPLSC